MGQSYSFQISKKEAVGLIAAGIGSRYLYSYLIDPTDAHLIRRTESFSAEIHAHFDPALNFLNRTREPQPWSEKTLEQLTKHTNLLLKDTEEEPLRSHHIINMITDNTTYREMLTYTINTLRLQADIIQKHIVNHKKNKEYEKAQSLYEISERVQELLPKLCSLESIISRHDNYLNLVAELPSLEKAYAEEIRFLQQNDNSGLQELVKTKGTSLDKLYPKTFYLHTVNKDSSFLEACLSDKSSKQWTISPNATKLLEHLKQIAESIENDIDYGEEMGNNTLVNRVSYFLSTAGKQAKIFWESLVNDLSKLSSF